MLNIILCTLNRRTARRRHPGHTAASSHTRPPSAPRRRRHLTSAPTPDHRSGPTGDLRAGESRPIPRSAATFRAPITSRGLSTPSPLRSAGAKKRPAITESDSSAQSLAPAVSDRLGKTPSPRGRTRHADQQRGRDAAPPSKPWAAQEAALRSATASRTRAVRSVTRVPRRGTFRPPLKPWTPRHRRRAHKDDRLAEASPKGPHAPAPVRRLPVAHRPAQQGLHPSAGVGRTRRDATGPRRPGPDPPTVSFATLSVPQFYLRTS